MVVTTILLKTFDSVNRRRLIETLVYYKCDLRLIVKVAALYSGDETEINGNGEVIGRMQARNCIIQDCIAPRSFS